MRPGRTLTLSLAPLAFAGVAALCAADAGAQAVSTPASGPTLRAHQRTVLLSRPAAGGLVIGIDPETGMLVMPEPEALARLVAARASQVRASRPAPVYHANGTISLDVRSWMREYATASVGPDGHPVLGCVDGRAAADRVRRTPAPSAQEVR